MIRKNPDFVNTFRSDQVGLFDRRQTECISNRPPSLLKITHSVRPVPRCEGHSRCLAEFFRLPLPASISAIRPHSRCVLLQDLPGRRQIGFLRRLPQLCNPSQLPRYLEERPNVLQSFESCRICHRSFLPSSSKSSRSSTEASNILSVTWILGGQR